MISTQKKNERGYFVPAQALPLHDRTPNLQYRKLLPNYPFRAPLDSLQIGINRTNYHMLRDNFASPSLFPCESLVQKCEHFRDIELHVFQIKIFLVILLHLQEIIKFKIKFQQTTVTPCPQVSLEKGNPGTPEAKVAYPCSGVK